MMGRTHGLSPLISSPETAMETTAAATIPEQDASIWEDFIDIFYAPSAVFDRRRAGRFVLPLLILTVLLTLLFYATQVVMPEATQADFARAMEGQDLTPEQIETAQRMSGIFGTVGYFIAFPIGVMLTGAVLWIIGKMLGATATFAAAAMVATYSQAPRLLQQLFSVLQGLLLDSVNSLYRFTFSPARFLDPDTTPAITMALLSRLDLFTIWATVLLAIGLSVVGRIPRARAAIAAVAVWILAAVPVLLGTMRG